MWGVGRALLKSRVVDQGKGGCVVVVVVWRPGMSEMSRERGMVRWCIASALAVQLGAVVYDWRRHADAGAGQMVDVGTGGGLLPSRHIRRGTMLRRAVGASVRHSRGVDLDLVLVLQVGRGV